ncbi:hypothetical protein PSYMO_38318, partial [Pseudomonas amygdali pv. mori str. 301020]
SFGYILTLMEIPMKMLTDFLYLLHCLRPLSWSL